MTAYTEKQYVEEMIATRRKIHQTPEEGWTEFQAPGLYACLRPRRTHFCCT